MNVAEYIRKVRIRISEMTLDEILEKLKNAGIEPEIKKECEEGK